MKIKSTTTVPKDSDEMARWLQLFREDFTELVRTVERMPRSQEVEVSGVSGSTVTVTGTGAVSQDPSVRISTEQKSGRRLLVTYEFDGGGSKRFTLLVFGG